MVQLGGKYCSIFSLILAYQWNSLPKPNPLINILSLCLWGCGGNIQKEVANRATVQLIQRVRYLDEDCVALGWKWASIMSDILKAPGSTSRYLCLPFIWCNADSDFLHPLYLWNCTQIPTEEMMLKALWQGWTPLLGDPYSSGLGALVHHYVNWHNRWICSWDFSQG
jgi:hypothetical protein